jgi:hypothetical protein
MAQHSDPVTDLVNHGRAIVDAELATFEALVQRRVDNTDPFARRQRLEIRLGELVAVCYQQVPSAAVPIDFVRAAVEPFEIACRNLLHWESHAPRLTRQEHEPVEAFASWGTELPTEAERWASLVDDRRNQLGFTGEAWQAFLQAEFHVGRTRGLPVEQLQVLARELQHLSECRTTLYAHVDQVWKAGDGLVPLGMRLEQASGPESAATEISADEALTVLGSNGALKLWQRDPIIAFERLRDSVSDATHLVSAAYQRAQRAAAEQSLADVLQDLREPLCRAIQRARAIWFETPISRYLDRDGPVHLNRHGRGNGNVSGSCYHDLLMVTAEDLDAGIANGCSARDYVRFLRYRTAAGEDVAQHVSSFVADIRCECQSAIARWKAETMGLEAGADRRGRADPEVRLANFATDDDAEPYDLMEWLNANPSGDRKDIPARLKPWMSVLQENRFVNDNKTMLSCPTVSDLGQIALQKYRRKTAEVRGSTTNLEAAARPERAHESSTAEIDLIANGPAVRPSTNAVPAGKKSKRGRKADTDSKADQRIAEAWGTKSYRSYAELANEFGISERDVEKAIDRHRHRKKAVAPE